MPVCPCVSLPPPTQVAVFGVKSGTEVKWQRDAAHTLLTSEPGILGRGLIPNLTLPPGKYLVQVQLDSADCPSKLRPDPASGELPRPLSARVVFLPSTDDRSCSISVDDSQQRYFKSVLDLWSTTPVTTVATVAAAGGKVRFVKVEVHRWGTATFSDHRGTENVGRLLVLGIVWTMLCMTLP